MQLMRPVIQSFKAGFPSKGRWVALVCLGVAVLALNAHGAMAEDGPGSSKTDFIGIMENTVEGTNVIADLLSYISFIMGAVLMGLGLNEMRRVVDGSGGGGLALRHPLAKLFFGGAFLAFPFIAAMIQSTMRLEGASLQWTPLNVFRFGALKEVKADSLSGMISNVANNIGVLTSVSAFAAFLIGVFFVLRGLQMTKAHIENPGNSPLPEGLKRLAAGGALLSFPMLGSILKATMGLHGGNTSMMANTGWNTKPMGSGGLDNMLLNFVTDIATPAYFAIEIFCFTAGALMILFAMQRLVRTAQDGPRGPLGFGTIIMFFVAGALISFPQLLTVLDTSVTGAGQAVTRVEFMSLASDNADLDQNAKNVFSAVLAFMAIVGFLSIVRGLFMLKTMAEGGQATMMQVTVHLVAGALAVNLGSLINAIQHSLGLSPGQFAVVFS